MCAECQLLHTIVECIDTAIADGASALRFSIEYKDAPSLTEPMVYRTVKYLAMDSRVQEIEFLVYKVGFGFKIELSDDAVELSTITQDSSINARVTDSQSFYVDDGEENDEDEMEEDEVSPYNAQFLDPLPEFMRN